MRLIFVSKVVCHPIRLGWLAIVLTIPGSAPAATTQGILGSKHDLSLVGPGPVQAVTESEVCLFCHTPHRATADTPLWNHRLSDATYTTYESSTARAQVGQPTGSSKLCLSCHDGTVALGMINTRNDPILFRDQVTTMPEGRSKLGTDLSDDHPISFLYDRNLVSARPGLRDPNMLTDQVRLDHAGQMQCTSCHDPHDNRFGRFLVLDNHASALCLSCHNPDYWQQSAHKLSTKTWNQSGADPWPNSDRLTVSANACENCHTSHNAATKPRLLTFAPEENTCLVCHNGNVAAKNLANEFNKLSTHPIRASGTLHDPMEDPINGPRHVECVDCHNPHAARSGGSAQAPNASGAIEGVQGVNSSGLIVNPIAAEYELCYRCHADSLNRGPAHVDRIDPETNTRLEFRPSNASFHPVEAPGKNNFVPSLLPPNDPGQPDLLHRLSQ